MIAAIECIARVQWVLDFVNIISLLQRGSAHLTHSCKTTRPRPETPLAVRTTRRARLGRLASVSSYMYVSDNRIIMPHSLRGRNKV